MKYDSEQMTFVGAAATAEESAALRLHYEIMAAAQAAAAACWIWPQNQTNAGYRWIQGPGL